MKISVFDRVMLVLYMLLVIALLAVVVLVCWQVIPADAAHNALDVIHGNVWNPIIISAIGLVVLVFAVKLIFAGAKKQQPQSALVKVTENGAVRIALSAIDSLVQKHVRRTKHIRDVRTRIVAAREGGVRLLLQLALMPEAVVPELSEELQKSTKEYIETYTGISVLEVRIHVESTMPNADKTSLSRVD